MSEKIPIGWKWVKLGEVGIVITGKTPSSKHPEDWGYDMPFVTPTDFKNYRKFTYDSERYLSSVGINKLKNKVLPEDSILVTCIGYIGKVVMNKVPVVTNQQINSIIPDRNIVFPDFLYYVLVYNYEIFRSFESNGTAVPILNKTDFENIEVSLPPLPEQKAIAEVLSSIDDKIELLHRQNKTLEEMAMTLFRQWFIEPTKDGLPEGWEEVSLGEIIEISSGKSIEKGKLKGKGLYPVLGANGEIGRNDDWLYEGELIYTGRVGTLGNVFIVFKNEKVWLTDNTLVIKPKKNEYFYFVYFTLKNAKLDEYNSGSTQPLIRQSDIKKIEIFLPKINFLKDFEVISRNLFTKIQFNTSQIQTLDKLRDTLLPKLMSGELRVKV